jgi:predicted hydrocarbon binding protein
MLAVITAALMSATLLSGCAQMTMYEIGYESGYAIGESKGYDRGVDDYENKKYAASFFDQKYEQLNFNSISFFYISKCEQNIISGSIGAMSRSVLGLSLQSLDRRSCAVFFQKPADPHDDRMTTLGHEVAHCLYSAYHSEEKDMQLFKNLQSAFTDSVISSFLKCEDISDEEKNRLLDAWKVL